MRVSKGWFKCTVCGWYLLLDSLSVSEKLKISGGSIKSLVDITIPSAPSPGQPTSKPFSL